MGLRGQILSALFAALTVSFSLLSVAVVQLTEKANHLQQQQTARSTARLLASFHSRDQRRFDVAATELIADGSVTGLAIRSEGREPRVWGRPGEGAHGLFAMPSGPNVHVWLDRAPTAPSSLSNILLFYVAVTGGVILLLGYILLTGLIVRPLDALTRASQRLTSGNLTASVPVRGAGEVSGLAQSFNEMATQLRADRQALEARLKQLEETTNELASTQDQLVRSAKLASVGRLSAGVAHEIGNPLAAILGLVELLEGGTLDEAQQQEFLGRIHRETQRIHKIIKDLLTFARQEQQPKRVPETGTDLVAVVEEAVELVRPQKDLQRIDIQTEFSGDRATVPGSSDRWTQLVVNLLLNAADALGGSGTIRLSVKSRGGEVVFQVSDTGAGIDPEILPEIFEPFVTSKPSGKGTGLGLAVCHTLVEQLGGSIRARNNPEGGATFEVSVPAG